MKAAVFLALLGLPATAQDIFARGEAVFKKSCAQGYCHGTGGTQGRAPKLIGRNFETDFVTQVVRDGVPNTGMPAFGKTLGSSELTAVIAYVLRVSGADVSKMPTASAAIAAGASVKPTSAEIRRGRALFFDALKAENRCGSCHALESQGIAIGPNLAAGGSAYTASALRAGKGKDSSVQTATAGADSFPALVVSQTKTYVKLYDLTVPPPVLRTFETGSVRLSSGNKWTHAGATRAYTDAELGAVAMYLGWLAH
ncbi:MAG: c-type cytochrome [Bryobacteraceae bacterium]